jgi:hypothetical protein
LKVLKIRGKTLFVFFAFLLLSAWLVQAVSITPPIIRYDFVQNQENTFVFYVDRAPRIDVSLEFEDNPYLSQYVRLIDSAPNGTARQVTVIVSLPASLQQPGPNRIYIKAKEMPITNTGINALAAIRGSITINVPYPGYYFITSLSVFPVNQGETALIQLSALNRGTNPVYRAYVKIDIYETDGKTIMRSLTTETKEIATGQTELFDSYLPTTDIKPGSYNVVATFYHDGGSSVLEGVLNVGTKYIEIKNYTTELEQGKINKFEVDVESRWNNPIKKVYSVIALEGALVKTPTDSINPWETKRQTAYIDTTNMAFGEYDANLTVIYGDTPDEELSTSRMIRVKVLPPPAAPTSEPEQEKPTALDLKLTPVTILIIIIVVLVMFDLGWLLVGKLRESKKPDGKKPTHK